MAKMLNFILCGRQFCLTPTKIERKKLYGWTELHVATPDGKQCIPAGLNSDGVTLIPQGATKTGMITELGQWMDRCDMIAVNADGEEAQAIPSSFNGGINLTDKASVNDLLDCNINAVYQIYGDDGEELTQAVGNDIFHFPFSYRGGYEAAEAFLLAKDANLFILSGTKRDYEFVGLEQEGVIDDDGDFDIDDELDFGMM